MYLRTNLTVTQAASQTGVMTLSGRQKPHFLSNIFKVPTKILPIYERSPYYLGTKLWGDLPHMVQDSRAVDVFAFKK